MAAAMKLRRLAAALVCLASGATPSLASDSTGVPPRLYVALLYGNAVAIYGGSTGRKLVGQITDGVQGPVALATDAFGTLYVSNSNNTITAYARGGTSPSATYSQGVGKPFYLAIGPDGSLYASDPVARTVVQFGPFSQTPSRTITFDTGPQGIALDHHGNLFVVVGTDIERFEPGATHGKSLGFDLEFGPGPLGLDAMGNFAVLQSDESLDVFARQAPHARLRSFGFPIGPPTGFAFSADGASLYEADAYEYRAVRAVYPQGNFANVIDGITGYSSAIAVDPALIP